MDEYTKSKLVTYCNLDISGEIKHPTIIKNTYNTVNITEKMLKNMILEHIDDFLYELGEGYAYVSNEYKIKYENIFNYIALLLFNIKYNCYVVIELKTVELRKEHIGQIDCYINYIDNNLKSICHDKTTGIIIAMKGNKFVMQYSTNKNIFDTTYELI